jgi:signal transduction histidine kinase
VARSSPIPVKLLELTATRLPETAEATAYYVVAEAVTNAQKHAMASSIRVRAHVSHQTLHVGVVDDGAGGAIESEGSGLQGLRDRVEALGGTFEVDSIIGHGTRVAAEIPTRPPPP